MQKTKKLLYILIPLLFIIMITIIKSYANSNTLTVNFNNPNVNFKLYKLTDNQFRMLDDFKNYPIPQDDEIQKYAQTLENYVITDKTKPHIEFNILEKNYMMMNIENGLYLLIGDDYVNNDLKITVMPCIIKVENNDNEINPKFDEEKLTNKKTELSIIKIWKGDNDNIRPKEIIVVLYENGKIKEEAILNKDNNWKYIFKNLNNKSKYNIIEKKVPNNYYSKISKEKDTIIIENNYKSTSNKEINKNITIPQTGLVWWPVLYFVLISLVFFGIAIGTKQKWIALMAALFFLIAMGFCIKNSLEEDSAYNSADNALNSIQEYINNNIDEDVSDSNSKLEESESVNELYEPPMATIEIDGKEYIGYLIIPSVESELPILSNWNFEDLKISACKYSGSVYKNFIIAGHNYKNNRHFGVLKNVKPGDEIFFISVDNKQYAYIVDNIEVLAKTEVEKLENSDSDLSLFTCTSGGQERLVIRCIKTGVEFYNGEPKW